MKGLLLFSNLVIPAVVFAIVLVGAIRKVDVYETFIRGANEGFKTVLKIMPTLVALMIAVGVLRASGFLEYVGALLGRVTEQIGFPGELMPLTIVKMFSSSAAVGLLLDIYQAYGPDSKLGFLASVTMCCTETIFYTMSVYFMTAKVKKSRYTLAGALLVTLAGLVASVWIAG